MIAPAGTTGVADACDTQDVPSLVNKFPAVLGATNWTADVPFPNTTLLAVKVAAPVPPLATGSVPVTPVVSGSPVALVSVPDAGVPNTGAVKTGAVNVLFVSV